MSGVLITGIAGFVGGHLADAVERAGHEVRGLDIHEPDGAPGREFVLGDVRDRRTVREAVRGCDVVVNNAALVPVTRASAEDFRAVNVGGTRNTLDAAEEEGAYVLHVSSSAIYGVPPNLPLTNDAPLAPMDPYGRSKAEAERVVRGFRDQGLPVASLRPRTLLGAGRLGLFDVIFSRTARGRRVPMFGRGENVVQLCDVEDYCAACLRAVELRANGDYNVGAERFGTVREDLGELIRRANTGARLVPVPVWAIKAVLVPLDAVGLSPFRAWHYGTAAKSWYFDISQTVEELGWRPHRGNVETLVNAYEDYLQRSLEEGSSVHRRPLEGALARLLRG